MKQKLKLYLSILTVICLVITMLSTTKIYGNDIMPLYDNISKSNLTTSVDSNGILKITYNIVCNPNSTSKIVITTYFEQKYLGLFWQRVDTGSPNDEWVSTIYNYTYNGTRTFTLPETGTYRTTVIYQVYGTNGSIEQVTCQKEVTY